VQAEEEFDRIRLELTFEMSNQVNPVTQASAIKMQVAIHIANNHSGSVNTKIHSKNWDTFFLNVCINGLQAY
jgi:hypothetical protein